MKKYKKVIIFILITITYLLINLFVNQLQNDEIWSYGFSYNIYKGLIPYKDYNMVITPFYPFFMSLIFHIFGGNQIIFQIENAILLTITTLIVYKLIDKKIYLLGLLVIVFCNSITFPSYNVFLLMISIFLIYLEEEKKNDYFIGFIIGLIFLTKQSIGIFMFLPSFYYYKDFKKIIKRFIGFLIPCIIFLLFLLFNNCLSEFLDLCLFGLFDFGEKNTAKFNFGYIVFIVYIIIDLLLIIKDKKNINNYYALAFSSMMIPLFDVHHSILSIVFLILVIMMQYDIKTKLNTKLIFYACLIIISIMVFNLNNNGMKIEYPNNINNFEYRFIRKDSIDFTNEVLEYMKNNKNRKFVFINSSAYYFRLASNERITYLDLTNNGNYGYKGSKKIIRDIKKNKDAIFFVFEEELGENCQSDKESMKYVINNAKKIGSIKIFDIYEFE